MKKEDLQPHDWFFKIVFSNSKSVKTLLDIFLPKLSKKVEIDSLKLVNIEKQDCSKNPHRHSERSEESHIFLFKSKNQKRDPSDFVLRMTRKGKLTKILEHPYSFK
jgi:hypothetical protein